MLQQELTVVGGLEGRLASQVDGFCRGTNSIVLIGALVVPRRFDGCEMITIILELVALDPKLPFFPRAVPRSSLEEAVHRGGHGAFLACCRVCCRVCCRFRGLRDGVVPRSRGGGSRGLLRCSRERAHALVTAR